MIKKACPNPRVKTHFLLVQKPRGKSAVMFWFEIDADGIPLSSDHVTAQIQQRGKFLESPLRKTPLWADTIISELSEAATALTAAIRKPDSTPDEIHATQERFEFVQREMAPPDFMEFMATMMFRLKPDNPNGEIGETVFVFFRGAVWSSVREMDPAKWLRYIDEFTRRDMPL